MVGEDQTTTHEDGVIFSAQYSILRVWFSVIVAFLFPMYLFFYAAYMYALEGDYLRVCAALVIPSAILLITLDSILFDELRFYQDRVVKIWHPCGQRTIYYSRAKVIGPPKGYEWLTSVHAIRATKAGKDLVMQMPIGYIAFFFPSLEAKMIGKILDCLTQNMESNPRMFKKTSLPKEVIWRSTYTGYQSRC